MDFRKRIIQELKLSELQAETLLNDYVVVCEKLAKEYHTKQLNIGGVGNLLKEDKWDITFEEYENKFEKREIENEIFYQTNTGLKTIEELELMYDLYIGIL